MVRVTVNVPEAAAAVPEIKRRMLDAGVTAPLIGDFHYNGHLLLTRHPDCAAALDKYRINPGNVGTGRRRDEQFTTICKVARRSQQARADRRQRRLAEPGARRPARCRRTPTATWAKRPRRSSTSAWCSPPSSPRNWRWRRACERTRSSFPARRPGPRDLIAVYRDLARKTDQPLHLGLTEAGMGTKGLVWSASAMGVLLNEGIGDTIRVSLTPRPGGDRREEVYAACELLQALGLRSFSPSVTACPGCGRTTSSTFQELAERTQDYIRERMPDWKKPAAKGSRR